MAGDITDAGASYSQGAGLIFVFNLIVGTGALTMPYAFSQSGWLLSLVFVIALAFMSYLTVTFVIETMAAANAVLKHRAADKMKQSGAILHHGYTNPTIRDERTPLLDSSPTMKSASINSASFNNSRTGDVYETDYYDIAARVEMGQMASLFFNKIGVNVFYICLAIYLYGDLAIYAAAVPKSLRDIVCTYQGVNKSFCNRSALDTDICWEGVEIVNRMDAYRIFVAVFTLFLGPFFFFNVQKTKYLQYFTTVMRWFAFITMITLALIRLGKGQGQGHPVAANFAGIPSLFGICVYSFMCHHSLPSLVTPIRDKSRLFFLFGFDYVLILGFYALLSFTGIFSFSSLRDLYTLNFEPDNCGDEKKPITTIVPIQYILALFPVFTLSTNFPIIGVTLRNNLKTLFYREDRPYPWAVNHLVFPLATILPPVAIALGTANLDQLVGITGSYAGTGVQYLIPIALVYCARKDVKTRFADGVGNKHASPFRHSIWLLVVLIWAIAALVLVTVNHIITKS